LEAGHHLMGWRDAQPLTDLAQHTEQIGGVPCRHRQFVEGQIAT
jgi:hypothetical protein